MLNVIEWVVSYKGHATDKVEYKSVDGIEDGTTLEDLHCGNQYELQIQGRNQIGKGPKSATIRATTRGSGPIVPVLPKMFSSMHSAPSALILHADHWPSGGCRINYIEIERYVDSTWKLLVAGLNPDEQPMYTINNLINGGEVHQLRMTAYSDAGVLPVVLDVQRVFQDNGSFFSIKPAAWSDGVPVAYETMIVIVSMAVSSVVLLCSVATIVYVLKKK